MKSCNKCWKNNYLNILHYTHFIHYILQFNTWLLISGIHISFKHTNYMTEVKFLVCLRLFFNAQPVNQSVQQFKDVQTLTDFRTLVL